MGFGDAMDVRASNKCSKKTPRKRRLGAVASHTHYTDFPRLGDFLLGKLRPHCNFLQLNQVH